MTEGQTDAWSRVLLTTLLVELLLGNLLMLHLTGN
jgi:hypothetical protein